jgi:hypothetical protein
MTAFEAQSLWRREETQEYLSQALFEKEDGKGTNQSGTRR